MRKAFFVLLTILISATLVWLNWVAACIFVERVFVPTIANVREKDLTALIKCLCGISILWGGFITIMIEVCIMWCKELY